MNWRFSNKILVTIQSS